MLKFKTVNLLFLVGLALLILYNCFAILPFWAYFILTAFYLIFNVYGSVILSSQFFLPTRFRGNPESNCIALTFDDGPIAGKTEEILKILNAYQVRSAFFCIGNRVASNPRLTQAVYEAGHLIGNHSYWHRATFDLQSARTISGELIDTDNAIYAAIGVKPNFFRPPFGVTNPMVAKAVRSGGYTTIGWSVRSFDTVIADTEKLLRRITKSLKGGDIILLHDYSSATLMILPPLIEHIERLGLKIVRVDELLNEKAYA